MKIEWTCEHGMARVGVHNALKALESAQASMNEYYHGGMANTVWTDIGNDVQRAVEALEKLKPKKPPIYFQRLDVDWERVRELDGHNVADIMLRHERAVYATKDQDGRCYQIESYPSRWSVPAAVFNAIYDKLPVPANPDAPIRGKAPHHVYTEMDEKRAKGFEEHFSGLHDAVHLGDVMGGKELTIDRGPCPTCGQERIDRIPFQEWRVPTDEEVEALKDLPPLIDPQGKLPGETSFEFTGEVVLHDPLVLDLRAELLERARAHEDAVHGKMVTAADVKRDIEEQLVGFVEHTGIPTSRGMDDYIQHIKASTDAGRIHVSIPVPPEVYWELLYEQACDELADRCEAMDAVVSGMRTMQAKCEYGEPGPWCRDDMGDPCVAVEACDALRAMEGGNDGSA